MTLTLTLTLTVIVTLTLPPPEVTFWPRRKGGASKEEGEPYAWP